MKHDKETGPTYWRSLDELAGTAEFQEAVQREFPGDEWDRLPPATRRQFLRVMGASLAMAGLTACRWPKEEIVPFAHRPEGRTPGVPEHFATSMELGGAALGMLVTSFDGRPIKAEGNRMHPDSLGALTAIAQADVLQLYDPDRSRRLLLREGGQQYVKRWSDFEAAASGLFAGDGTGVAVLAGASSSPTRARARDRFLETYPQAGWYEYEPISRDNEREGTRLVFGQALRVHPKLDHAGVVACLDADPLFDHPSSLRMARDFAAARHPETGIGGRLYVAESSYSLTGVRADHRLAVASNRVPMVLACVAHHLVAEHHIELPAAAAGYAGESGQGISDRERAFAEMLAADLVRFQGGSVILVGPRQEPAVHALAAVLNQVLGANGTTISYTADPDPDRPSHMAAIRELAAAIESGSIETLLILGGNPAYDAPADLRFGDLLAEVPTSIHLSLYDDETSKLCTWHLPQAHGLESWGDGRAWDGTLTLRQPLIAPLYDGKSTLEVLNLASEAEATSGYDLLRKNLGEQSRTADFEGFWRRALHDGVVEGTAWETVNPRLDPGRLAVAVDKLRALLDVTPPNADRPEVVLTADSRVGDGRFANNGWLQELPDALTKVTWDNAILISPATARELGIADGEIAIIESGGTTVEAPAFVLPGQAYASVTLALGYGRTSAGQVGDGVGVNAYPLRTSAAPHIVAGATIRGTGRSYRLATTQDHFAIDTLGFKERNRRVGNLVREASLDAYLANPEIFHEHEHHPPLISLWKDQEYEGEQWGMAIDLNTCIGCNACVVACQAENNIPVVGREQVLNQREMHWIRIDRYFKTDASVSPDELDSAEVVFQPMTCVHCENAPCEQVCPVAATQHTTDGLNAMVYNRCVGTRYCSNNCPFKVRRFNFFNYHRDLADTTMMQFNPEVTVRARGVMEKCTFCTQRIEAVRIAARNDNRPIADGEIVPACAQTCPTQAITFGNLNDPRSALSALREEKRSYATLAELNIRPRTHYLGRLQNRADGGGAAGHGTPHGGDDSHGKETA
jgi:molybdopterin-containing oxidoreductase family iron-sulfur binding subunit